MAADELAPSVDDKLLFDNKKLLIDAMLAEKRDLRGELIGFERAQIQVVALFSLGVAAFMKISLDSNLGVDEKRSILIAISQFSYILCLVVNSVLAWINVHYSYIRAVEKKINKLFDCEISIWESVMVEKHINKIPSSFTLGFGAMGLSLIGMFVYMLYIIGLDAWDGCFVYFGGAEGVFYLVVFVMNLYNTKNSYLTASAALKVD